MSACSSGCRLIHPCRISQSFDQMNKTRLTHTFTTALTSGPRSHDCKFQRHVSSPLSSKFSNSLLLNSSFTSSLLTCLSSPLCSSFNSRFSPLSSSYGPSRTFLTEAYQCDHIWESILSEALAVDPDSFEQYSVKLRGKDKLLTGVEIDLLAHKLQDVEDIASLEIFEPLLYSVRKSQNAADIHMGTSHAIVRGYLDMNLTSRLMDRLIPFKLDYGIFLDEFSATLLLNELTLSQDWTRCSVLAEDLMLQETFFSPLLRRSCALALMHHVKDGGLQRRSDKWALDKEEAATLLESTEEELRYMHFRPNEWNDGHFDLADPKARVAKALTMIGAQEGGEIGASCRLLGAALQGEESLLGTISLLASLDRSVSTDVNDLVTSLHQDSAQVSAAVLGLIKSRSDCCDELQKLVDADVHDGFDDFQSRYEAQITDWSRERKELAKEEIHENQVREVRELAMQQLKELEKQEEILTYFENEFKLELLSHMATEKSKAAEIPKDKYDKYLETLHPDLIDLQAKTGKTWLPVPNRKSTKGSAVANKLYHHADYYRVPWWSI